MAADYSAWLTKHQAAEALGISTKWVEKLAKEGRLQQALWRPNRRGHPCVVYHPEDVERERLRRAGDPAPFVVAGDEVPLPPNGNGHALVPAAAPVEDVLRSLIAAVVRAASESSANSQKLFLTLTEAAQVSGLPRSYLRRLIRDGELEATPTRPQRVRRRDLEKL